MKLTLNSENILLSKKNSLDSNQIWIRDSMNR